MTFREIISKYNKTINCLEIENKKLKEENVDLKRRVNILEKNQVKPVVVAPKTINPIIVNSIICQNDNKDSEEKPKKNRKKKIENPLIEEDE